MQAAPTYATQMSPGVGRPARGGAAVCHATITTSPPLLRPGRGAVAIPSSQTGNHWVRGGVSAGRQHPPMYAQEEMRCGHNSGCKSSVVLGDP